MEDFPIEIVNSIVLLILGVLFFFQNRMLNTMKSFVDVFDIKKVKEYVKMNEETVLGKVSNLIADDNTVLEMMNKVAAEKFDEMSEHYSATMGKEHIELFTATAFLLQNCLGKQKEEQLRFINEFLPNNKAKIMPVIFPDEAKDTTI